MNRTKTAYTLIVVALIITMAALGLVNLSRSTPQATAVLDITANTDMKNYRQRQKATLNGTVTIDGSPATDFLVLVEIANPSPYGHNSFRTLQVGNPTGPWSMNISSVYLQDSNNNPIDTIKAGSNMYVSMSVDNLQGTSLNIYATTTVYDANMVAIEENSWTSNIGPLQTVGQKFLMQVPTSATSGQAVIISCVYSDEPSSGGIAYCPEYAYYYYLSRTQTGLLGITQPPQPSPQNTPGAYADTIRLPTDPRPGTYSIYVTGQSTPAVRSSATTSFTVQSTTGIPPQASFAYWPSAPTINITVNFDASSSTPEGYGDMITRYEWDFGDGTPHYIRTGTPANPTATHAYTQATRYVVTLNVTNNEGLWCTTSKPINVSLGHPPTASFTWLPQMVVINQTVTFDASNSTAGDFSTLTNYAWNFSDGTGIFNVTTPQTTHGFTQPGNYTVMLTVLDSAGRTASTSATVQVQNATIKIYDLNGDHKIDGRDLIIVSRAFGSYGPNYFYPGSPATLGWNPIADVNGDNKVDGRDIIPVSRNYGKDP
jgi:PKD repeat protein